MKETGLVWKPKTPPKGWRWVGVGEKVLDQDIYHSLSANFGIGFVAPSVVGERIQRFPYVLGWDGAIGHFIRKI